MIVNQQEIERKFLLKVRPDELLVGVRGEAIRQGYLLSGEAELRIRERAGICTMTVKRGSGLERFEQECPIPPEQFAMLWPLTEGRRIEKVRYVVSRDGLYYEIDIFEGPHAPLMVLEIEFSSREASREFSVPAFAQREVTEDKAYKNAALALDGLPTGVPVMGEDKKRKKKSKKAKK